MDAKKQYSNYITGKNLQLIKSRLIAQSWRGSDWSVQNTYSTFIIQFEQNQNVTTIYITHPNYQLNTQKV